ncbi:Uma2 family endonuclease [Actinomycetota bacterium Odt1-20B]
MSALTVDHSVSYGHEWDDIVRTWEGTDAPEGCKVEIIEGLVTVTPAPTDQHGKVAWKLQRPLTAVLPEDWGIFQNVALDMPSRLGRYQPDLFVAPEDAVEGNATPVTAVELVVEITSPRNASHDRITKRASYAAAAIPLYLLIDRWAPGGPTITLYGEPTGDVYRTLHACKFGETIKLPDPFDVDIDTSEFPTD